MKVLHAIQYVLPAVMLAVILAGCGSKPVDVSGTWNATIVSGGVPVPFRLELTSQGGQAGGAFFDGDRRIPSNSGTINGDRLHLHFDTYNADLDATLRDGALNGNYTVHKAKKDLVRAVSASRMTEAAKPSEPSSSPLAGDWELRGMDGKEPVAWKMVVRENGPEVNAAILRLDGDTGALTGTFRDGTLSISHFSGARPALLEGTVKPDGTLDLTLDRKVKLTGVRAADAAARGLPPEPDAFHTTTVKNADEPLRFSAPDLNGQTVSASDARFRGKAMVVSIGGSWCPNCMDEAPFLIDLYRKYHARGLEIVGLNFESGDTDYDRKRVRSFVDRYGVPYPVLIAGTTDQVAEKLPQLVRFSAFPTTIFVGRDGCVKGIHDGFASVATGVEHEKLKQETDEMVERLLR